MGYQFSFTVYKAIVAGQLTIEQAKDALKKAGGDLDKAKKELQADSLVVAGRAWYWKWLPEPRTYERLLVEAKQELENAGWDLEKAIENLKIRQFIEDANKINISFTVVEARKKLVAVGWDLEKAIQNLKIDKLIEDANENNIQLTVDQARKKLVAV